MLFAESILELIRIISPDSEVVAFANTADAESYLSNNQIDFLFMDLVIPNSNVNKFVHQTRKKYSQMVIVILTSLLDMHNLQDYLQIGVNGYMSKAINIAEFSNCLEKTYKGETFISSDLSGKLASVYFTATKNNLTKKELEVLKMVAAGHSVEKTASLLKLSPYTILAHRRNIMSKLNLHSAAELVRYAYENNIND
jgi:DNA-binding NarL/FixJ family response regulator